MFDMKDELQERIEVLELENENLLRECKELKNKLNDREKVIRDYLPESLSSIYWNYCPETNTVVTADKSNQVVTADKRKEIIDYLYEFNVSGDIKIEEIADDIISIIEKE